MGTVEFTGLVMMHTMAEGQVLADATHRLFTMPALVLNRSSRVMPAAGQHGGRRHSLEGDRVTKVAWQVLQNTNWFAPV